MRWLWALIPGGLIGGCWLDTAGLQQAETPSGATSTQTTSDTSTTTSTGTATGSTTTSTTSSGGGGGAGGPVCNDGIVEPPEDCEDGDAVDGDGCSAACTTEATCNNGVIEPGEECDSSTECASCTVQAPSPCIGATNISMGSFSGDTTGSTQLSFGDPGTHFNDEDCGDYQQAPVVIYRHDVGPYPEGLAVFAGGTGSDFDDAFVWSYVGCGAEPVACSDDAGQLLSGDDAAMFTPILAPHTVLYVAIADFDAADTGTFQANARTFRYGAWFPYHAANPSFSLSGAWSYAPNTQLIIDSHDPSSQDTATSPSFYVAGIEQLQITFQQRLGVQNGTTAGIEVAFDSGSFQPTTFYDVSTVDTDREFNSGSIPVPPGARDARFRFVFSDDATSNGAWSIAGVFAGEQL